MAEASHVSQSDQNGRDRLTTLLLGVVLGLIVVVLVATVSMVVYLRQHGGQPRSMAEVAVARAETGVSDRPQDPEAWVRLAYAYAESGRFGDAQNALDQGDNLGGSPVIDLARADVLRFEGKLGLAIQVYDQAIKDGLAAQKKAAAELEKKDIRIADPETYLDRAYYGRSLARKAGGDLDGAIADLRSALKIAPTAADLQIQLGDYLAEAGKRAEAAKAYREALRYIPDSERAKAGLAEVGGGK